MQKESTFGCFRLFTCSAVSFSVSRSIYFSFMVSCGKLSWLLVRFRAHHRIDGIVSYRTWKGRRPLSSPAMGHWGTCPSISNNIFSQLTSEPNKVYNSRHYILSQLGILSRLESTCTVLSRGSSRCHWGNWRRSRRSPGRLWEWNVPSSIPFLYLGHERVSGLKLGGQVIEFGYTEVPRGVQGQSPGKGSGDGLPLGSKSLQVRWKT